MRGVPPLSDRLALSHGCRPITPFINVHMVHGGALAGDSEWLVQSSTNIHALVVGTGVSICLWVRVCGDLQGVRILFYIESSISSFLSFLIFKCWNVLPVPLCSHCFYCHPPHGDSERLSHLLSLNTVLLNELCLLSTIFSPSSFSLQISAGSHNQVQKPPFWNKRLS